MLKKQEQQMELTKKIKNNDKIDSDHEDNFFDPPDTEDDTSSEEEKEEEDLEIPEETNISKTLSDKTT
jgi:hypothetical protein